MNKNYIQSNQGKKAIKKALIAYSSRAGCTEEVALKIKEKLENSSISTQIVKLNDKNEFKKLDEQDISQYNSILLGSSIFAGRFDKNIKKFLTQFKSILIDNKRLGFFICCMKANNTEKIKEAINQYIDPSLTKYNLNFSLIDAFGGRLDFSPNSSMNFATKKLLKKIMLKDNPDLLEIEPKVYDFRNWSQIDQFATNWANLNTNA